MNLLPQVKKIETKTGVLKTPYIAPFKGVIDERLAKAVAKLPTGENGAKLVINTKGGTSEKYTLKIEENTIEITSEGLNGVFYGIQTLKQILKKKDIPCLLIEDEPDFEYRGFYHDITRGKVPTVDTLKGLVDTMAYYKMNSLQLYVEHTFEFREIPELNEKTGYITAEEIKELDEYCYENFVDFIPSIATFGHMYEILEQEKYKHLRVAKNYKPTKNFWQERLAHHTIDPLNEESFELVKSLIDQYYPLFRTDKFNICGDETFDLKNYGEGFDTGKLYIDFVKKIINNLESKGKKIMMWADVLLDHPETIEVLPDDVYCLNWDYLPDVKYEKIEQLAKMGKKQIVCPGTWTWSRLCERIDRAELNITRTIDCGYANGAIGVLNTNWGDYANHASIESSLYGLVLGAAKSWNVKTELGYEYDEAVNEIVYGGENAVAMLRKLSDCHNLITVNLSTFWRKYYELRYGISFEGEYVITKYAIEKAKAGCLELIGKLKSAVWENEEAREEFIICAEGVCVIAQLVGKMYGIENETVIEAKSWLSKFKEKWLLKNKLSEFPVTEEMILWIDSM